MKQLALSGRQPWWWWIVDAPEGVAKRIENRREHSSAHRAMKRYRGPILLHASAGVGSRREFDEACSGIEQFVTATDPGRLAYEDFLRTVVVLRYKPERHLIPAHTMPMGGIVGRCRVVGLITPDGDPYDLEAREAIEKYKPDLRWHIKSQWGHILADVERLPFTQCKGALGLWTYKGSAPVGI